MRKVVVIVFILALLSVSFAQGDIQAGITLKEKASVYTSALDIATEMPRLSEEYDIVMRNTDIERVVEVDNKSLFIQLKNQQMDVVVTREYNKTYRVISTPELTIATNQEISIEDEGIKINQIMIKPSHVTQVSNQLGTNIEFVGLEIEEGKPVYTTIVKQNRRLLGVFDVEINSEVVIDVEQGGIVRHQTPWWYFLTFKK